MRIQLKLNERAVLFKRGLPHVALGPGTHRVWGADRDRALFDTDALIFKADPAVRSVLPSEWFQELTLGSNQRALLFRNGRPIEYLRPGVHWFWTVDPSVEARVLSVDAPLPDDPTVLSALVGFEMIQVLVGQHQRGLLHREGRFERVLDPGRHAFWNTSHRPTSVTVVDMRRQLLPVAGQELMTKDKVTLRLSVAVEWAPSDPALHNRVAVDPKAALYAVTQLALRDFVAAVTLDELLEGRAELTQFLMDRVAPEAVPLGVQVVRVGVKDVMLPGEMKSLLNRVIEADKQAAANAILRKEEAAHTRTQANAAQLMADRPLLLRLKELEALENIAGRIDELRVVVGAESVDKLVRGNRAN